MYKVKTVISFIFFLTISLGFLIGTHALLYFSVINFFNVTESKIKTILLAVIIFLALSFILSAIFIRLHDNIISRGFYYLSAIWLGLIIYISLAIAIIWIINILANIFATDINLILISSILFCISCVVVGFGIYNTFNPTLTNVKIQINQLPDVWKDKKIIQLSDVHLGVIHGVNFLNEVVNQVNEQEPEIIVITGDLFDGMDGDLEKFIEPLNKLKAKQGVYFAIGNHEEYLGLAEPIEIIKQTDIIILDNKAINLSGLQLVGVSYNNNNDIENLNSNLPTILLNHVPTDILNSHDNVSSRQSKAYLNPSIDFTKAKELGVDLQLSGHTHAGQFFPFNIFTKYIFKGYDYGLKQQDDFKIYISSGTGTWGPPLRIGTKSEIVIINL